MDNEYPGGSLLNVVYKRATVFVGQGGLVRERLAEDRPWVPLLDDVPETMQSLCNIPVSHPHFFMSVYSFF